MAIDFDLSCPAPGKLNLFLHVVGRRPDGYHLLQSVFRLVDWCDTLHLSVRRDGRVRRVGALPGVPEDEDLCVRAARLLRHESGCSLGADIMVDKSLPMGGGMGGGSSDAASTLLALNRLWALDLDRPHLIDLGLRLGADLPFFLFGQDAFVEGIGERLEAVEMSPARYVVIAPQVQVATREIFSDPRLTRDSALIRMADFAAGMTRNDLETVARLRYPEVDRAVRWLEQFAPARMTGSGSCVFAQFPDEAAALRVVDRCPPEWIARSVESLAEHPLRHWVRG